MFCFDVLGYLRREFVIICSSSNCFCTFFIQKLGKGARLVIDYSGPTDSLAYELITSRSGAARSS